MRLAVHARDHGRSTVAVVGCLALFLGAGVSQLVLAGASGATGASVPLGVYVGAADPSGVSTFASTTGAHVTIASDYLDGSTWATIDGTYPADDWTGSGYRLALGVDMLPNSGASLADGAAGDYNSYFTTLAQNLVAAGESNAILRIGWEWDGSAYPWYVSTAAEATDFATYWKQIVTSMRAVPGADFNYSWYYGGGGDSLTTDAWPGSAYVSSIELDYYDQTWTSSCGLPYNNTATTAEAECAWNADLSELTGFASFAASEDEPIGFGEWGVIDRPDGHGLGDDPVYINDMASWMAANNVSWASYFDFDSDGYNSVLTDFPNSLSAFESDFAGNSAPTTTTTTAPTTTTTTTAPTTTTTTTTTAPTTTTTTAPTTTTTTDPPSTTTTTDPPSTDPSPDSDPPPSSDPPAAPTDVSGNAIGTTVTLQWTNPAGASSDVLYRDGTEMGTTSGTSYDDTDVPVGTHTFAIAAVASGSTGPESSPVSVTVLPPPAQVTGLTATVSGSSVTLSWDNPQYTLGDSIYQNGRWIAGPGWPNPVVSTYDVSGLANGTYSFTVCAYDSTAAGPVSAPVTVTITNGTSRHHWK